MIDRSWRPLRSNLARDYVEALGVSSHESRRCRRMMIVAAVMSNPRERHLVKQRVDVMEADLEPYEVRR